MTRALRLLAALALLGAAGGARAQYAAAARPNQLLLGLSWEAALPRRGLADFVDRTSFRALDIQARYSPYRQLSLGLAAGWTWLSQDRGRALLELPPATLRGDLYRRVQLSSLRLGAQVYLGRGVWQPWLGASGGPLWLQRFQQVGEVVARRGDVAFAWGPELGLLWTFRPGLALQARASWNLASARLGSERKVEWLSLGLGVAAY